MKSIREEGEEFLSIEDTVMGDFVYVFRKPPYKGKFLFSGKDSIPPEHISSGKGSLRKRLKNWMEDANHR